MAHTVVASQIRSLPLYSMSSDPAPSRVGALLLALGHSGGAWTSHCTSTIDAWDHRQPASTPSTVPLTAYFDSHCHVAPDVASDARQWEGEGRPACHAAIMSTHEASWPAVRAAARRRPRHRVAFFGVHPWFAHSVSDGWCDRLRALLVEGGPSVMCGEIGLDKACRARETGRNEWGAQKKVFRAQLLLAHELNRPVSVHCVRAVGTLFDTLDELGKAGTLPPAVAMHSFGAGGTEWVKRFLTLPTRVYFGFSECINHSNSRTMEKVEGNVRAVPDDRLLLESDLDDPTTMDEACERFCGVLAAIKGWSLADAAARTTENAWQFLGPGFAADEALPPPPPRRKSLTRIPHSLRAIEEVDFEHVRTLFANNNDLITFGTANADDDMVRNGTIYVDSVLEPTAGELGSWSTCQASYTRMWVLVEDTTATGDVPVNGGVVGCIGVKQRDKGTFELVRMYVEASRQRRGYGRELVESLWAFASEAALAGAGAADEKNDGAFVVTLSTPSINVPAIGFYCSLGFALEQTFVVQGPDGNPLELTELRCGNERAGGRGPCASPPRAPHSIRVIKEADFEQVRLLFAHNECLVSVGTATGDDDMVRNGKMYVKGVLAGELACWSACQAAYTRMWVLVETKTGDTPETTGGVVVGCVGVKRHDKGTFELVRMYVEASRRRRGYGRELVESLRAFATDETNDGLFELSLTTPSVNVPGIDFYCSLGFGLERTFVVPGPDGKPLDLTELRCGNDAGVRVRGSEVKGGGNE